MPQEPEEDYMYLGNDGPPDNVEIFIYGHLQSIIIIGIILALGWLCLTSFVFPK